MRMFVAVVPPQDALADLADFLAPRQESSSGFRWTVPEQWHLTLAFLGEVRERTLDDLEARLARAARRRTPFRVQIVGGGAFPNARRARALYAGIEAGAEGDVELVRLATGVRAAATKSGNGVDGARFRPHVTLARLSRPTEVSRWLRILDTYRGPSWAVGSVALVESHLGEGPRGRPRYEEAGRFPLGSPPA